MGLLHVTPRLRQAAHLFYKEGGDVAETFERERCFRVLQGRAEGVVRSLREMATKKGLTGNKTKTLAKACNYLARTWPTCATTSPWWPGFGLRAE